MLTANLQPGGGVDALQDRKALDATYGVLPGWFRWYLTCLVSRGSHRNAIDSNGHTIPSPYRKSKGWQLLLLRTDVQLGTNPGTTDHIDIYGLSADPPYLDFFLLSCSVHFSYPHIHLYSIDGRIAIDISSIVNCSRGPVSTSWHCNYRPSALDKTLELGRAIPESSRPDPEPPGAVQCGDAVFQDEPIWDRCFAASPWCKTVSQCLQILPRATPSLPFFS